MTQILHISSSSNLQSSVTRQTGHAVIESLRKRHPDAALVTRDLIKTPVPHLSPEFLGAMFENSADGANNDTILALSDQLTEELLASDLLVIESPMYNFSVPSALKAWIDHVVRAGRTFRYGPNGPEGLTAGKKAVLILGRGGIYSAGPAKPLDFQESYLRAILGFIGIHHIETLLIEGVAYGPEKRDEALAAAAKQAQAVA